MQTQPTPSEPSFTPGRALAKHVAFEALEAQITELWGNLTAATYRFLVLIAEYDRSRAYERHGLANTAQWLNWQCGIRSVAAREKVRVARALEALPEISAAFASGEVSYSKVRAMTRVATAANESVLVNVARHGTASHVEKLVRKYRWTERRDAGKLAHAHANRAVHYFYDDSDTFVLHARLPAEIGAIVRQALDAARDVLRESEVDVGPHAPGEFSYGTWALTEPENSPAARRADALRHLAETFLAGLSEETDGTPSADRYQVVVHVDQAVLTQAVAASDRDPHLSELDDGPALAVDTARRLACDGTLVGLVEGEGGEPLDVGRKTRSIPPGLKRALHARDRGCRFPGCDRTRFTEGHHVRHWANGGETKLANLVTLCSFHHTLIHEGGFGVTATDDGLFVFTRPDGRRIPDAGTSHHYAECFRGNNSGIVPSGSPTVDSSTALRAHLQRLAPDLHIDASTSRCRWLGEPMDYSLAIEGMQFRSDRALLSTHNPSLEAHRPATG